MRVSPSARSVCQVSRELWRRNWLFFATSSRVQALLQHNPYGPILSRAAFEVQLAKLPPAPPAAPLGGDSDQAASKDGTGPSEAGALLQLSAQGAPPLPESVVATYDAAIGTSATPPPLNATGDPYARQRQFLAGAAALCALVNEAAVPALVALLRSRTLSDATVAIRTLVELRRFGVDACGPCSEAMEQVSGGRRRRGRGGGVGQTNDGNCASERRCLDGQGNTPS